MIPTEPIGSIPRSPELQAMLRGYRAGTVPLAALEVALDDAVRDTLRRFEATGSPVITDGEQRKYDNFITYCVEGGANLSPDGFELAFGAGRIRRLPRLVAGPFRYADHADRYLRLAMPMTTLPVKQAVISPSALSLLYPAESIPGYGREAFIEDLLDEHASEVRKCFEQGCHSVQIDFTEGRLACKIDPTGTLLDNFITLNNLALVQFSDAERARIGIHTCAGSDCESKQSREVDYADLLPSLFELKVGNFFVALAGERDRRRVLALIRDHLRADQRVFVGVIDPTDPVIETPEQVRDRILEAAAYIPLDRLGTTDDCGFSPFCDDVTTTRDTAFAKIEARIKGTRLASAELGIF